MNWLYYVMMIYVLALMVKIFLCLRKRWCVDGMEGNSSTPANVDTNTRSVSTNRNRQERSTVRYGGAGAAFITINTQHHINMAYTPPEAQEGAPNPASVPAMLPAYAESPPDYDDLYPQETNRAALSSNDTSSN